MSQGARTFAGMRSRGSPAWAADHSRDPLSLAVPPPEAGPDVCGVCRGWARPGFGTCFSCRLTLGAVSRPCPRVRVVTVYRPGSPMHGLLRGYKDGSGRGGDVRAARVAAVLARHLWQHAADIAPDGWDGLVVVPSTTGRRGPHPLEAAVATTFLAAQLWPGLLTAGACPAEHRRAADHAFVLAPDVDAESLVGARLVLLDDTWTTGARAQSAASALQRAGASVEAVVVIGRVVTPVPGAPSGAWWERHAHRSEPGPLRRTA